MSAQLGWMYTDGGVSRKGQRAARDDADIPHVHRTRQRAAHRRTRNGTSASRRRRRRHMPWGQRAGGKEGRVGVILSRSLTVRAWNLLIVVGYTEGASDEEAGCAGPGGRDGKRWTGPSPKRPSSRVASHPSSLKILSARGDFTVAVGVVAWMLHYANVPKYVWWEITHPQDGETEMIFARSVAASAEFRQSAEPSATGPYQRLVTVEAYEIVTAPALQRNSIAWS
ncbi:hypothetical protein B0H16DRAFT_1684885 [Mycena metata]|uniref:BZIP domain-containing protein n=1 Tax=Mycena metata TaxID=1033252 RepID=A0AAD7JXF0_9AGAR|nr:hypothetical protein B0H16DRAFT_1684885 [Mycena metata]